jgi:hypothetical protein
LHRIAAEQAAICIGQVPNKDAPQLVENLKQSGDRLRFIATGMLIISRSN